MSMTVDKIKSARLNLARERPYLSMALWALNEIPVKGLGTFGVDMWWRLYYDPDLDWDVRTTASVLYHEVQHLLRLHPERGRGLNAIAMDPVSGHKASLFNLAGDAEINDDIRDEQNWTLPENCVYPSTFAMSDQLMAEQYYNDLMQNMDKISWPSDDGDGDGEGEGDGSPKPGMGNCGSAADGQVRPWEDSSEETGGRKVSEAEGKLIGRKVADDIKQRQKSRGDVPAHWERWADNIIDPTVDWRTELKTLVRNAVMEVKGQSNYSYQRPSRRASAYPEIVMPAMTEPVVKVAVVVDTSGSMGQDDLEKALGEIKGILTAVGIQDGLSVLSCDAMVHTTQKVFNARQVKLGGGGGTDMRVGIEAAQQLRPVPNVIVILSDGFTPWPEVPPKQKIVIGIIGGSVEGVPHYARGLAIG